MKEIFEQGYFKEYSQVSLEKSVSPVLESSQYSNKTTVFISHKHDDLDDLKGLLGFLEKKYNVDVYIDSKDLKMPKKTSAQTAINIKERIKKCDKFILLATNGAIDSKWCNWELGYGDAQKYSQNIALFPMKPKGADDYEYEGSEYMEIYPYISYYDGKDSTEKYYNNGQIIAQGFYVCVKKGNDRILTSLENWINQ